MGLIINKTAIITSALTVLSLKFGAEPWVAFLIALFTMIPLKLLPFFSKKIFSETGIVASIAAIVAYTLLNYKLTYSFLFGSLIGYLYLYFWVFIVPRIFK